MHFFAKLFLPEYARLDRRYAELRDAMDAREEELCTDVEELTRENEYLKSELAGLRIQLDRSRAQLERRSSELYSAATADRDAEIAKLSEENGCLRRRVTELQNANQLLVNTLGEREEPLTPGSKENF